ncbi:unnamed protein product [Ectocarpus sp. 4 AP-2014]
MGNLRFCVCYRNHCEWTSGVGCRISRLGRVACSSSSLVFSFLSPPDMTAGADFAASLTAVELLVRPHVSVSLIPFASKRLQRPVLLSAPLCLCFFFAVTIMVVE